LIFPSEIAAVYGNRKASDFSKGHIPSIFKVNVGTNFRYYKASEPKTKKPQTGKIIYFNFHLYILEGMSVNIYII
jgi:hypothetical protein